MDYFNVSVTNEYVGDVTISSITNVAPADQQIRLQQYSQLIKLLAVNFIGI
jgi:hypothetical protein